MIGKRVCAVLGGSMIALAMAACSSGGGSAASPFVPADEPPAGGPPVSLMAADFSFSPDQVTVPVGGSIEFANEGAVAHSFTVDEADIAEIVEAGGRATVSLVKLAAGDYAFHCQFHQGMAGTLTVTP